MAYISDNKSNFITLNRLVPIVTFILLFSVAGMAQQPDRPVNPGTKETIVHTFPNPASTYLTFDIKSQYRPGMILQIYDGILGKLVTEIYNISPRHTLQLSQYSRGVYSYKLIDPVGKVMESRKFQISR